MKSYLGRSIHLLVPVGWTERRTATVWRENFTRRERKPNKILKDIFIGVREVRVVVVVINVVVVNVASFTRGHIKVCHGQPSSKLFNIKWLAGRS